MIPRINSLNSVEFFIAWMNLAQLTFVFKILVLLQTFMGIRYYESVTDLTVRFKRMIVLF